MGLFDYKQWDLIEVATSYREFGVPRNLAEEFIQDKYYVSQKKQIMLVKELMGISLTSVTIRKYYQV